MPLLTNCALCGQPFTAPEEGTYDCPHCSRPVTIHRTAAKAPASDYWQVAKLVFWVLLALVFVVGLASSFLG